MGRDKAARSIKIVHPKRSQRWGKGKAIDGHIESADRSAAKKSRFTFIAWRVAEAQLVRLSTGGEPRGDQGSSRKKLRRRLTATIHASSATAKVRSLPDDIHVHDDRGCQLVKSHFDNSDDLPSVVCACALASTRPSAAPGVPIGYPKRCASALLADELPVVK
jgi:hypothetical protein